MTWTWSHTDEAYLNAYHNLMDLSDRLLLEIYAEIRTYQHLIELEDEDGEKLYDPWSEPFDQDVLREFIDSSTSSQARDAYNEGKISGILEASKPATMQLKKYLIPVAVIVLIILVWPYIQPIIMNLIGGFTGQ